MIFKLKPADRWRKRYALWPKTLSIEHEDADLTIWMQTYYVRYKNAYRTDRGITRLTGYEYWIKDPSDPMRIHPPVEK